MGSPSAPRQRRPGRLRRRLLGMGLAATLTSLGAAALLVRSDDGSAAAATVVTAQPAAATASASSSSGSSAAASSAAASSAAASSAAELADALDTVADAADDAGGTIAVVVLDVDGTTLASTSDADTPSYTASLVKLLVVEQLLAQDEAGELTLDSTDLERMERAIERSDDDAMNALWVDFDGPQLVEDAVDDFGLTGTASTEVTGQWGQSTTTAADYAQVLSGLADQLDTADLAELTSWLSSTTDTAADGFDQAFGMVSAQVQATGTVEAKQGWMCCVDSTRQLHSAGVLADGTVVVLLGNFATSTTWDEARTALDTAAHALVTALD